MNIITSRLGVCLFGALLAACQSQGHTASASAANTATADEFVYAQNLSDNDRNMRKWDSPIFADLDQDGWVDMVLDNHGYAIQILWNNKGKFAKPWDLLMGDYHGITVGDIDGDGLLELMLAHGGGSGNNVRPARVFKVHKDRHISAMHKQDASLASMRGRTLELFDGDADGDLDLMDFAFPNKNVKGSENYIYENSSAKGFVVSSKLAPSFSDGQKSFITDINNDGIPDLLMYGHGNLRAFIGTGGLGFKAADSSIFGQPISDVTGIAQLDYDGDGDLDIYLSRGHSFKSGQTFCSADNSTWAGFVRRGPVDFGTMYAGQTLHIRNYQSPWPNKRLMLGESAYEYKFKGETYSGNDVDLVRSDAFGWPGAKRPKRGLYVGYVGNEKWHLAADSWSPLTVAVTGLTRCSAPSYTAGVKDILLENTGSGYRVAPAKVFNPELANHVTTLAADINNDGWPDVVAMPRGNLVDPLRPIVLFNQAGKGFKKAYLPGVNIAEPGAIGLSMGAADINRNGRVDIAFGNERGKWSLYHNQLHDAKNNHYVELDFGAEHPGNATWMDARIELKACGRTQVARAGATSASYSRGYDRYVHFGLGQCKQVDKVRVIRTSGDRTVMHNVKVDAVNAVTF